MKTTTHHMVNQIELKLLLVGQLFRFAFLRLRACVCVTRFINLYCWHLANSTKRSEQKVCKVLVFKM